MSEKNLYLVRGLPGAGKSSFVQSLLQEGEIAVAADDFMVNEKGEYEFDWQRLEEVHALCKEKVARAMRENVKRIFVHNTFKIRSELEPYQTLAAEHGYKVFSIVVENRHGGISTKNTPGSTVEKMRKKFEVDL